MNTNVDLLFAMTFTIALTAYLVAKGSWWLVNNITEVKGGFIVGMSLALSTLEGANLAAMRHQWVLVVVALSGTAASVGGLWYNLGSAHKTGVIEGLDKAHEMVRERLEKPVEMPDRLVDHD